MLSLFTYSARQKRTNVMTPKTFAVLRKLQLKKILEDLEPTGFLTKHSSKFHRRQGWNGLQKHTVCPKRRSFNI